MSFRYSVSSVQSLSRVQLFVIPWTAEHQASLSITSSWSLLKLMSIESVMASNHLILCRPRLFPSSTFPNIRVFSNKSVLRIWWPKYWSFSFSISPSNEYSGLISFRMCWSPEIKGSVCFKYIWRFAETHPLIWKVCVLVFQFHWDWKGNLLLFVERIRGFLFPKFTVCLDFWMTRKSYGKEHESYSNWDAAMFRSRTIYCNSIFIYLWKVLHNAWHISA